MSVSKKYQIAWKPTSDLGELNRQLATQFQRVDEMLQSLYRNALQAEFGSWTPADQSGGALVLADPTGRYMKMGDMVILMGYLKYPSTADSKTAIISGLPFAPDLTTLIINNGPVLSDETTVDALKINTSGFLQPVTTADAAITNATLSTNYMHFTVIYRTLE